MKVPCRWLADYVEIEVTAEAVDRLARRLTLAGLEVEGIERTGVLQGAVVGTVKTCVPMPDSDHLSLCDVDLGTETAAIVCGAPNVAAGQTVPVVLPGGTLPGGFSIERRKIRGQVSNGMICSKAELGLEEKSDGIWEFPADLDLALGTDLNDLLEYDDFILDIKVPSNRPDCASVYGIAREVAAILDRSLKPLDTSVEATLPDVADLVRIEIADPKDTPRYAAKLMDGLRIGASPLWLQHRLLKAGMRPLSNVVDATNYVMLELGHPLHPFDADLVHEPIVIRRANKDEAFRTLDDVDRRLSPQALMIADQDGGVAMAGVMGGQRSEIRAETTRLLLEIACFYGYRIRMSARSVGLRSEASQRFERDLNPETIPLVAERATHLIQQLTGCDVHRGLADAYPSPVTPRTLRLRPERAVAVLGIDVDLTSCKAILERLELPVEVDGEALRVEVPAHRTDLQREVDLIEDVGRIYGYDQLTSASPRPILRIGRKDRIEEHKDIVRNTLVGQGMIEVITDGFDNRLWRERLGGRPDRDQQSDDPGASRAARQSRAGSVGRHRDEPQPRRGRWNDLRMEPNVCAGVRGTRNAGRRIVRPLRGPASRQGDDFVADGEGNPRSPVRPASSVRRRHRFGGDAVVLAPVPQCLAYARRRSSWIPRRARTGADRALRRTGTGRRVRTGWIGDHVRGGLAHALSQGVPLPGLQARFVAVRAA